jgi:hypothetical protein
LLGEFESGYYKINIKKAAQESKIAETCGSRPPGKGGI